MARLFDFESFKINVLLTKNLKAVVSRETFKQSSSCSQILERFDFEMNDLALIFTSIHEEISVYTYSATKQKGKAYSSNLNCSWK